MPEMLVVRRGAGALSGSVRGGSAQGSSTLAAGAPARSRVCSAGLDATRIPQRVLQSTLPFARCSPGPRHSFPMTATQ